MENVGESGGVSTEKFRDGFSTGRVERKRVILWKTLGKMWKDKENILYYFVVFIFVMIAFTVSA